MGSENRGSEAGGRLSFEFTFNGRLVKAYSGDSVASALVRSGLHVFSRSMKFHRPRGLYCGASRCYSCVMRVNGVPGVRTCATRAEAGMVVETEGGFPTMNTDLLSTFDHIFRHEFDYQRRFIRPKFMVPAYQRIVRRLASPRHLPARPRSFGALERLTTDVLVIGYGVSGNAAVANLRSKGINPIIADRHGTNVFPPTIAFGFYEDGRVGLLTETGGMLVRAKAVLLATGRLETGFAIPNADLPGVMLPEAIEHLVTRGVRPGSRAFIIGDNDLRGEVLKHLELVKCEIVGKSVPEDVLRIAGGKRVRFVETRGQDGNRKKVHCDLVIPLGPRVPYVSLAQQAGCELVPTGDYWLVRAGRAGETTVPGVFACGSVTGITSDGERKLSGELAAAGIISLLGAS